LVLPAAFIVSSLILTHNCQAITASYGHPYRGYLENGVVFPDQFPGYHLRDENRSYTTPEVVGALLDAIEAVRAKFPDTCDLFIADFSVPSGGSAMHHRSHQNGRDVDIGLYAKGNRPLNTLVTMGEDNLDVAKTWCLIDALIASQRVQYIFLDRRIQRLLYDYAATQGYDEAYLGRVFGNVRGALIQHIRNHDNHMHVRFFTPWSTLAAHIGPDEPDKLAVVEAAQQSYLPRKVNYYVNGSEKGIPELASSFGVTTDALCKWNHISQTGVLVPGSCLVFYKRSFESESVLLARSLQPGFIAKSSPSVRMASLNPEPTPPSVSDSTFTEDSEPTAQEAKSEVSHAKASHTYKARRGDTLDKIARRKGLDVKLLCRLNGIKSATPLRSGQTIRMADSKVYADSDGVATDASEESSSSSSIGFASDPKRPESPAIAYYTVRNGGTLKDISQKTGIPISSLCQINGLSRDANLKPGQKIRLTQASSKTAGATRNRRGSSAICFDSVSKKPDSPTAAYYTVQSGGTLKDISKKTGIPLSSLCQLNGLSRNSHLKSGQRIKLTQANLPVKPALGSASCSIKSSTKKHEKPGKADKKSSKPTEAKSGNKPAAKPGTAKSATLEKSKSKPADKQKQIGNETSKSGKLATTQRKVTEAKPSTSKAKTSLAQK
jgi:LysM repeat protein/murein endopeptidase